MFENFGLSLLSLPCRGPVAEYLDFELALALDGLLCRKSMFPRWGVVRIAWGGGPSVKVGCPGNKNVCRWNRAEFSRPSRLLFSGRSSRVAEGMCVKWQYLTQVVLK